jgi:hypothetical protein
MLLPRAKALTAIHHEVLPPTEEVPRDTISYVAKNIESHVNDQVSRFCCRLPCTMADSPYVENRSMVFVKSDTSKVCVLRLGSTYEKAVDTSSRTC